MNGTRGPRLPTAAFWLGRRVLLTGHTGFKGAWAALWLQHMGAHVCGFALAPDTEPSLFDLAKVGEGIASHFGDLRDPNAVREAVAAAAPEIVLHLAAQPIVRQAFVDPVATIATNVLGTAHLLDALRDCPHVKAILVVTSDKVYANNDAHMAFSEGDRLGGKDPYSASKAATELVAASFAQSYFAPRGIALATARGGNVVGGGDFAVDRIVPDVYRAVVRGERLVLRMPGATRPWQHVLDCLAGYLVFAEALCAGEAPPPALNFGPEPGRDVRVADIAEAMLKALGKRAEWDFVPATNSIEMKALAVDARLARQALGWRDLIGGADIVKWTADWYGQVIAGEDARKATLAQIAAYAALANTSGRRT